MLIVKKKFLQNSFLYKFRELIAFVLLFVTAILLMSFRFATWPDGISEFEITSATKSGDFVANFVPLSANLIDAPWHFFQWLSLEIFGFSVFALRLPASIFALGAAAIFVYLAKLYFGKKTAFFAGIFLITNVGFLSLARGGGEISLLLLIFALALLFLRKILALDLAKAAGNCTKKLLLWLILFAVSIASLFYFSGGIYLVAAIFLATILNPTSRAQFLHNKNFALIFNVLIFALISPIFAAMIQGIFGGDFAIFAQVFLLQDVAILTNLQNLAHAFFALGFSFAGGLILPAFSIVEILLAIFGLFYILRNFHTPRDFLFVALLLFSGAMALLDTKFLALFVAVVFLFIAQAISRFLLKWSELFPLNPYPRVLALGLLATVVLISGWINYQIYFLALNYDKNVVYQFDAEFPAVEREISQLKNQEKIMLIVPENRRKFYENFARKMDKIEVSDANNFDAKSLNAAEEEPTENSSSNTRDSDRANSDNSDQNARENSAKTRTIILDSTKIISEKTPQKIVTNARKNDAVVLRIY